MHDCTKFRNASNRYRLYIHSFAMSACCSKVDYSTQQTRDVSRATECVGFNPFTADPAKALHFAILV